MPGPSILFLQAIRLLQVKQMRLDATKPVFRVFEEARLKPADYLEIRNFACSKPRYDTFQKANNKGADQTARMRRLVCAYVITPGRQVFSRRGSKYSSEAVVPRISTPKHY